MYRIELHQGMKQFFELFYRLGLWSRGDRPTVKEKGIKLFYSIYHWLLTLSFWVGAIKADKIDESILLFETGLISLVFSIEFCYVIWEQKELIELSHRIGSYSIDDHEEFTSVNRKLNIFVKVADYFFYLCILIACIGGCLVPFAGDEKQLFFNIGFPLDYQNNEIAFWLAYLFTSSEVVLTLVSVSFSIMMWYLMFNCSLNYQVLQGKLRNMGVIRTVDGTVSKLKISDTQKENLFLSDIIKGIDLHKDINDSTRQLESFFSNVFSAQLATGALCICASSYCLAYNNIENLAQFIIYIFMVFLNIFNIYMIMYLGNEITLSSNRLSYYLFESDWIDRTESTKKCMIIFGERLKQVEQLVILKLYPLTLETFTKILNSAYSMFNILKNLA